LHRSRGFEPGAFANLIRSSRSFARLALEWPLGRGTAISPTTDPTSPGLAPRPSCIHPSPGMPGRAPDPPLIVHILARAV